MNYYVRMLEVVQSVRLVEQAIEKYEATSGDWGKPIRLIQKLPVKEAYMETEAPRGQMGFYVVGDGDSIPWRVRARSSSFCNLSVTAPLCQGILLADIPAIVGSLDVVMGENGAVEESGGRRARPGTMIQDMYCVTTEKREAFNEWKDMMLAHITELIADGYMERDDVGVAAA